MSTDDGRALVQDIAAKIRILREQRDELAEALRAFMALDATFTSVCDDFLTRLAATGAKEAALARAVRMSRNALARIEP